MVDSLFPCSRFLLTPLNPCHVGYASWSGEDFVRHFWYSNCCQLNLKCFKGSPVEVGKGRSRGSGSEGTVATS